VHGGGVRGKYSDEVLAAAAASRRRYTSPASSLPRPPLSAPCAPQPDMETMRGFFADIAAASSSRARASPPPTAAAAPPLGAGVSYSQLRREHVQNMHTLRNLYSSSTAVAAAAAAPASGFAGAFSSSSASQQWYLHRYT
jgi:hypothetical protein